MDILKAVNTKKLSYYDQSTMKKTENNRLILQNPNQICGLTPQT